VRGKGQGSTVWVVGCGFRLQGLWFKVFGFRFPGLLVSVTGLMLQIKGCGVQSSWYSGLGSEKTFEALINQRAS